MKGDIGKSFDNIKESIYIKYNGALIERTGRPDYPYSWGGEFFESIELVHKAVDFSYRAIGNSIK